MASSRWRQDKEVAELIAHFNQPAKAGNWDALTASEYATILKELDKCRKDFVYAARNYFWITNKKLGDQLFALWPGQELILQKVQEIRSKGQPQKLIIVKSRQLGCSTLIEGLIAWRTMFFSGINALVVSFDRDHAANALYPIMQFIYDRMPWWLHPDTTSRKFETGMFFENPHTDERAFDPGLNSRIYVKGATSSGVGMGIRLSACHISEFCTYDDWIAREIIDQDMTNALVNSPQTFAILESTAKGANRWAHHLWKKCMELEDQAEWHPLFLPWFFESSQVRVVVPGWQPEKREYRMREQVEQLWVRCDNPACLQYHTRFVRTEDRAETACVTCNTGTVHAYLLTDQQLSWMEHRRKTASRDDESMKRLIQEQCVSGDTRVSTESGITRIDAASNATAVETGEVAAWYNNGERDTVIVQTELGRFVTCTPEHRFFLPDGSSAEASELRAGQKIALSQPMFSMEQCVATWKWCPTASMSVGITEDWGRLLGYFMGDGCWTASGLRFACDGKDQDVIWDISQLCERIIGTPSRIVKRNDNHYLVESSNILWFEVMKGLGCIEQYRKIGDTALRKRGAYHRHVHTPECIWKSPKNVVRHYLSALIECDGHSYKASPMTSFFTCHEEFAREVQLLLLGFGINAKVKREDKANRNGEKFTGRVVRMHCEASNRFHSEIGFIGNRKKTSGCRRPCRTTFGFKNEMTDGILSVAPAGKQTVYDLTIKETHRFGANGVLVHNCTTANEAFIVSGYQIFNDRCQQFADSCVRDPIAEGDFDTQGNFHGCNTHKQKVVPPNGRDSFYPCFVADCTQDHTHDDAPCKIWEWPNSQATYCCGADIAEGLGGKSAYSVGCVIHVSQTGGGDRQVAVWRDNETGPIQFAAKLAFLGRMYGECLMCPECNKYDIVLAVMRQQYNYGNLYRWKHLDSINMMSGKLGWYTNHSSRPRLWQTMKSWLQQEVFIIRSRNCAEEMKNFTKEFEDDIMASGDRDEPDDELMACMISLYCAHETDYSDSLGLVLPKNEMTIENSTFVCKCRACGFTWPEMKLPDSMLDPVEFVPELDTDRRVVQSGGLRCSKCGNISVEVIRNQALLNQENTKEAALLREVSSEWSPDQEWAKWAKEQTFDDQNAPY